MSLSAAGRRSRRAGARGRRWCARPHGPEREDGATADRRGPERDARAAARERVERDRVETVRVDRAEVGHEQGRAQARREQPGTGADQAAGGSRDATLGGSSELQGCAADRCLDLRRPEALDVGQPEEAAVVGHLGAGAARTGDPDRDGHAVTAVATLAVRVRDGARSGVHQRRRADRTVEGGAGEDVARVGAVPVARNAGRGAHGDLAQAPDQGAGVPRAGPALVHAHRPAGDRGRAQRAEDGEQAQAVDVRVVRAHHHALGRAADSDRQPVVIAGGETAQHTGPVTLDDGPGRAHGPALRPARASSRSRRILVGGGTTSAVSRMFQARPD